MVTEPVRRQPDSSAIYPMRYRAVSGNPTSGLDAAGDVASEALAAHLAARVRELEQELETRARGFEADLERARHEAGDAARESERGAQSAQLAAAGQALENAIREFAQARDRYLAEVEQEVVRLALAIAARVLRREALMDPLLLSGAVRVALGQLSDTTEVRLRVPAAEHEMWSEMLRLMPNLPVRPEVVADEALPSAECRIETRLGAVDLGVKSQLAEIERGFFDLLEKREAITDANAARPAGVQGASIVG